MPNPVVPNVSLSYGRRPQPRPVAAGVPLAARPAGGGRKRELGGFELILLPSVTEDVMEIDPVEQQVTMRPSTWKYVERSGECLGMFVHQKAEAVRTMKVVMFDCAPYKPSVDPNRVVAPPPMGITLLCRDLGRLVSDLSGLDSGDEAAVARCAARYGQMRDTMATLRAAFSEAEGAFETAQELLLMRLGTPGEDDA